MSFHYSEQSRDLVPFYLFTDPISYIIMQTLVFYISPKFSLASIVKLLEKGAIIEDSYPLDRISTRDRICHGTNI